MPVELFMQNIASTDYTALVYVKRGKVLNQPVWPLNYFTDYLDHLYEADVIETFNGPDYKKITYSVMAEANLKPHMDSYSRVISLCGSFEKGYYVPGSGYKSTASEELISAGRDFKKKKNNGLIKQTNRVCSE